METVTYLERSNPMKPSEIIEIPNRALIDDHTKIYNPTLVQYNSDIYMTYRYEPYHGMYITELGVVRLNKHTLMPDTKHTHIQMSRVSSRVQTIDDPRTIWHDGKVKLVTCQAAQWQPWKWSCSILLHDYN